MFPFRKIEVTVLEVCITYGCGAFLMYVVGNVAYAAGKLNASKEAKIVLEEDIKT